jgi:hypothetical protein
LRARFGGRDELHQRRRRETPGLAADRLGCFPEEEQKMPYNVAISRLDMPARFLRLPVDSRGFPVPKFVAWVDGKPDLRAVDARWFNRAVSSRLCWLCGEPLGRHMAFVIGSMCAINRTTSEPPSHLECARFAVKACPFLTQPQRPRNPHDLPEQTEQPAGIHFDRNPGVSLIWVTEHYSPFKVGNGVLIKLGEPNKLEWYSHGREATREEIMASIDSGIPKLRELAEKEGPDAIKEFEKELERGLALVPKAA